MVARRTDSSCASVTCAEGDVECSTRLVEGSLQSHSCTCRKLVDCNGGLSQTEQSWLPGSQPHTSQQRAHEDRTGEHLAVLAASSAPACTLPQHAHDKGHVHGERADDKSLHASRITDHSTDHASFLRDWRTCNRARWIVLLNSQSHENECWDTYRLGGVLSEEVRRLTGLSESPCGRSRVAEFAVARPFCVKRKFGTGWSLVGLYCGF